MVIYDAVLDWGLNPGPPALEANTLPLGYRGGGGNSEFVTLKTKHFISKLTRCLCCFKLSVINFCVNKRAWQTEEFGI